MAGEIRIQMMESFSVYVNGEYMEGAVRRSRKGAALVQYLILNEGQTVPNSRLLNALWPEDSSSNPESALKTLVSRVRGLLKQVSPEMGGCIVAEHGGYRWECLPGVCVDLYEIEEILDQLDLERSEAERRRLYARLIELYRGDLLQNDDQREWIVARAATLHNRFVSAALEYVKLLRGSADYGEIESVCRHALQVDSFDDRFHRELMTTLIQTGRMDDALEQYQRVKQLYYRQLGVQPSRELQAFYRQILRTGRAMDLDLKSVREELLREDVSSGPMICDYSMFREMYRLMVFGQENGNFTVNLAAVTLGDAEGVSLGAARLDDAMLQLLEIMRRELLWGDVISRFGPGIYVLLLPDRRKEPAETSLERIRQRFLRKCTHGDIKFGCQIGPLVAK